MTPTQDLQAWGERLKVRNGFLRNNRSTFPVELVGMLQSQANDHLKMSRAVSERQKLRDGERLQSGIDTVDASKYLDAMALDVVRGTSKP
jgi:hypothetical protein